MEVKNFQFSKYIPYFLLIFILILGAYLRLYRIQDYMTFLGDEGRDVLVVKRMLIDHKFTLLGPTASVGGFFLGPIYYYFMLPFLWLFNLNPVGPSVMVGIFGTATVLLVYILGKTFFNTTTGLIAALLYALSPVVITYSHSSWNPNLVPFFATILILLIYRLEIKQKAGTLFWLGIVLGIGLQLHYLFLFLMIFLILEIFLVRKSLTKKNIVLGCVGLVLAYSPFLLFELRHSFPNTQMILRFVLTSGDTGFSPLHFVATIKDVINKLFYRLVGESNQTLTYLSMLMAILGIWYYQNRIEKKKLRIFTLWFVVTLFLFGLYKKPIYDYYLGIIFPVPFLLTGLGISVLLKKGVLFLFGAVVLLILAKSNWDARPFIYEPNRQLAQAEKISQFVLDKAEDKPFNFALITGQNSDHAYRYFFEVKGKKPVTIENNQVDPKRESVTKQLLVICEVSNCQPLGNSLWEIAGFGRAEIAGTWKVSVLTVYKLVHYEGKL